MLNSLSAFWYCDSWESLSCNSSPPVRDIFSKFTLSVGKLLYWGKLWVITPSRSALDCRQGLSRLSTTNQMDANQSLTDFVERLSQLRLAGVTIFAVFWENPRGNEEAAGEGGRTWRTLSSPCPPFLSQVWEVPAPTWDTRTSQEASCSIWTTYSQTRLKFSQQLSLTRLTEEQAERS